MITLLQKPSHLLTALLIFYSIICFAGAGAWGVIETSEARYAEISREMYRSGDWVHPTLLGIHHYHKPPVVYWLTATAYSIFGVNEFAARFFLQIAFLVQVALVYHLTKTIAGSRRMGLYAAVIYSGLPMVLASVRGLTTDAYLNTFILASIAGWLRWRNTLRVGWLYLTAFFLGIAFLTKGPVSLIVPLLVMFGLNRALEAEDPPFTLHHVLATFLFLVIAFSWFVVLIRENNTFADYFLFRHTLERYIHADAFSRQEPWWYYLVFAPLLALPWLILLPYGLLSVGWGDTPVVIRRVITFWILIPLLFFSFSSSKLVFYVLPLYAGLAIACAWYLNNLYARLRKFENVFLGFVIVIAIALSFACVSNRISPSWAAWLPLALVVIVLATRYRSTLGALPRTAIYSVLLTGFLILFSCLIFSHNELRFNSTAPIAGWIEANGMKDRQVIVYDRLLPSLAFHLDANVVSVNDGNRYLNREVQFETDDGWKNSLFYLTHPQDSARLQAVLPGNSILLVKGEVKDNTRWLTRDFAKRVLLGEWAVYYN